MNWKKDPNVVIGLCVALGLALLVIVYLMMPKSSQAGNDDLPSLPPPHMRPSYGGGPSQAPSSQRPPPQQPYPPPPPPQVNHPEQQTQMGGKPTIVLFRSNRCGHCTHMLPSWNQMASTLSQMGQIDVIDLEESKDGQIISQHNVSGFPTIRYYPVGFGVGNQAVEYKGNRTTESLLNFARSGGQSS